MLSHSIWSFLPFFFSLFSSILATGRITPLNKNDSACMAENLRMTNQYICDSEGNIICMGGWSQPEKLCTVPICDMNGKTCVHGECVYPNVCACEIGWDGPVCDECVPMGGCKHGSCKKPMECNCNPGWTGGLCDKPECDGCKHGCCHEPNNCICDFGWKGPNCTECMTLPNCKHGICVSHPFECQCRDGWQGLGCSKPICRPTCHPKNGFCKQPGECLCRNGWTGRDCDVCVPYPGCQGTCVNNTPWTCTNMGSGGPSEPDQWSSWSQWSTCSKTCGEGKQHRERKCADVNGVTGNCMGISIEARTCNTNYCAIDGGWAKWTRWSPCSTSCGTGYKSKSRSCSNPIPKHGGKNCTGEVTETLKCFNRFCPIDGRWSTWGSWGQCSTSCGNGKRERSRNCDSPSPANGGLGCVGVVLESEDCNLGECPIDAFWSIWTQWSACSKTCGKGTQERTRTCNDALFGGRGCPGGSSTEKEVIPCWIQETCSIDGQWSLWQQWSTCSVSCGEGSRIRSRKCDNPAPQFGGQMCPGNVVEQDTCFDKFCPIDGKWNQWNQWSTCSASCNGGTQERNRVCIQPQHGGRPCAGSNTDNKECGQNPCPIDGIWQQWSQWTVCPVTCGTGTQTRSRNCQAPQFGGRPCLGSPTENQNCQQIPCPIDGTWQEWSQWSICSQSCGNGIQSRNRNCQAPQFGGKPCEGQTSETKECLQTPCSIDGVWQQWTQWSTCSRTCDKGTQTRNRICQPPQFGGQPCEGSPQETQDCQQSICPIDGIWQQWSQWSTCTKSCGGGNQRRTRECQPGQFGGKHCEGSGMEQNACNSQPCPVGVWSQWSQWSICSKSCDGGVQIRDRNCQTELFGGAACEGSDREQNACNLQACPVEGTWEQWSQWSSCSQTCGDGTRTRTRGCSTFRFGIPCTGLRWEQSPCNLRQCGTDGNWGQWLQWGSCSVSCGQGSRMRQRHCDSPPPQNGGKHCEGSTWDKEGCFQGTCSINGNWGNWASWSSCSASCNNGTQTRTRQCDNPPPSNGGSFCNGERNQQQNCFSGFCPISGGFSEWNQWSPCTVNCIGDRGDQVRRRFCNNPAPQFGGQNCSGEVKQKRFCTGTIPKQTNNPGGICFYIGEKK